MEIVAKIEYLILLNEYLLRRAHTVEVGRGEMTYIDELDLPDLLDQLHGSVTVDEEGLGVVAEL